MTRNLSVLAPFSQFYGYFMARRRRRFQEKPATRLENCAVISVGNLTVGGTGKTPAVQYIARFLQENGARVAVVARGYGGTLAKHGAIVSDGKSIFHNAREVGDEPLLHARALPDVPLVIGVDRVRAAQMALEKFAPDVIVLDDAFQFYSLHRDLNVVLLDARLPLGNGHLLPRGTLREEADALRRADVLLLTRADRATPQQLAATRETLRAFCDALIYEAVHAPAKLFRVNFENSAHENTNDKAIENVTREYSHSENTKKNFDTAEQTSKSASPGVSRSLSENASDEKAAAGKSSFGDALSENALAENSPPQDAAREYSQNESAEMTCDENELAANGASNSAREYSQQKGAAARDENENYQEENIARNADARDANLRNAVAPIAEAQIETRAIENGEYSLDWLCGKTVSAASALADNAAFRTTLENLGARVVTHCARRDHHKWRDGEIIVAARDGAARGAAALIVTEKDAVKISRDAAQKSALPVLALGIELRITRGENEMHALLLQTASTRGTKIA